MAKDTEDVDWNKVLAAAAKWPEYKITDYKFYKDKRRVVKLWFREYKEAKVYHLSDDLVWIAVKLSKDINPEVLMEELIQGRLPFETTLLSWDSEARIQAYESLGMPHTDDPNIMDEVSCSIVTSSKSGRKMFFDMSYARKIDKVCLMPIGWETFVDKVEGEKHRIPKYEGSADEHNLFMDTKAEWFITSAIADAHPEETKRINEDVRLLHYAMGPTARAIITLMEDKNRPKKLRRLLYTATAGTPRFLGALFYLMNRPKVIRYVQGRYKPPKLEVKKVDEGETEPKEGGKEHTLTTFLPREKVVSNLVRVQKAKDRKKVGLHDVEGHWCYSHARGRPDCEHKWPEVATRRQICKECGMLRWRIEAHKRGSGDVVKKKKRILDFTGGDL